MAVRAMSRATGGAARANPRHTQPREGHRRPAADGRAPLGPAPRAMGGLARLQLGGQRGTTRTAGQNRGDRGTGDTTARAAASPDHRPRLRVAHRQPPGRAMAVRAMSRATGGAARANPRHTQPIEGHRSPAADGRAPLGPAPRAMGGLARLQLGGQRGTTRTARLKPGRPGDGRHHRESGSVARPPAKVRVAHRQPPGRAMAVRAMSRATGGAARANPRHTQPREGHRSPAADGRAPLGPAPGAMGGLARLQLGGQRGTTRTAGQNRGDRGTGDTTARAAASPDHRPRSEWLTGSHPDAPWPYGQCPERRGAPRARTPATPNRERDTGAPPRTAGHRCGPPLVQWAG
ncbi:hypothetical protein IHE45_20G010500 [Dioscorea alata]|uniref:Uncharacterized protein n=1 Tax=Dioscorea alata TaxID=55571 RepID=A0ACB7TSL9_DIOAL|nr:hypothetical protein IHE45_20G010500 [Dioscorea alata]